MMIYTPASGVYESTWFLLYARSDQPFLQMKDEFTLLWEKLVESYSPCEGKSKVQPYSLPSVGPGADPGLQAVSPQVTLSHPPGGRLPLLSVRPAVTYLAEEHHRPPAGTKLYCYWKRTGRDSNWQPFRSRVNALPLCHTDVHICGTHIYGTPV